MTECSFVPLGSSLPTAYRCARCGFVTPPVRLSADRLRRPCRGDAAIPLTAPGILDLSRRYFTAIERWQAAGRPVRSDAEVRNLVETHCLSCTWFDGQRCRHTDCGCQIRMPEGEQATLVGLLVHPALVNKVRMATERCPVGKW